MPSPVERHEKQAPGLVRLKTGADIAAERFGSVEGLAVVEKTTLALADHFIDQYGLSKGDPDVQVIATALAHARHKEFLLLQEVEKRIHERALSSGLDYGEVLFNLTKADQFREVYREMDRLHGRCLAYHAELGKAARKSSDSP